MQIGVRRTESACGCDGLVEAGVDAPGARVDQLGQCIYVGAEQFLESSVVQYIFNDGSFVLQLYQYLFRGDILARLGLLGLVHDFHLAKENVAYLTRTGYIKRFAGLLVDLALVFGHPFVENP